MIRDFATLLLGEFPAREPRLLGDFLLFNLEFTNNSDGPIVPRNRKQKELSLRHCSLHSALCKLKMWHER